ncbi:MAG: hypothetical protein AAGJ11_15580 [Bacteroidota bacterium]
MHVLTCVVLLAAGSLPAAAQSWVTVCAQVCPGGRASCSAAEQVPVLPGDECRNNEPLSTASVLSESLERAEAWLTRLGFEPPRVLGSGSTRIVRIGHPDSLDAAEEWGYYEPGSRRLVVHPNWNDEGTQGEGASAPVHELFHAVQAAYDYDIPGDAHDWIDEGTAEAVALAYRAVYARNTSTLSGAGLTLANTYGERLYSDPLHRPRTPDGDPSQYYATNHFWLGLGEVLGARDFVGYLPPVFEAIDEANGGLGGVHSALQAEHPDGLYHLFPEVLVRFARDSVHYASDSRFDHTQALDRRDEHTKTVAPVAATYHRIDVPDVGPTGAVLEIRLPDEEALHLIVDGERADLGDAERNVRRVVLFEPAKVVVHVVNVSRDVPASAERTYTLTTELTPLGACAIDASAISPRRSLRAVSANETAAGPYLASTTAFAGPDGGLVRLELNAAPVSGGDLDLERDGFAFQATFEAPPNGLVPPPDWEPTQTIPADATGAFDAWVEGSLPDGSYGRSTDPEADDSFYTFPFAPGTLTVRRHSEHVVAGTLEAVLNVGDTSGLEEYAESLGQQGGPERMGAERDPRTPRERMETIRPMFFDLPRLRIHFRAPYTRPEGGGAALGGFGCFLELAEEGELTGRLAEYAEQIRTFLERSGR